jgi:hypothetical protein
LVAANGRKCQQNQPNDSGDDNIRKVPINSAIPSLHSFDGHYGNMRHTPPSREGVFEITHRRAEIIPRLAVFIIFAAQSPTINLIVMVMLFEAW